MDWDRRRPAELRKEQPGKLTKAEEETLEKAMREKAKAGLPAREVAELVFEAVRQGKFYIFPHPELKTDVRIRMEDILLERNPTHPAG